MRLPPLYGLLFALGTAGCYEDQTGCIDPDAANYDLQADLGCLDCCTYPAYSLRITPRWEDASPWWRGSAIRTERQLGTPLRWYVFATTLGSYSYGLPEKNCRSPTARYSSVSWTVTTPPR